MLCAFASGGSAWGGPLPESGGLSTAQEKGQEQEQEKASLEPAALPAASMTSSAPEPPKEGNAAPVLAPVLGREPGQDQNPPPIQNPDQSAGQIAQAAKTPAPSWDFPADAPPPWRHLTKGLELGFFPGRDGPGNALELVILRIDPNFFTFSVHAATREGEALPLAGWAERHDLAAVINASMYLPDGRTSTGYLRVDDHVNNGRVVGRFGAFFVSGPLPAPVQAERLPNSDAGQTLPEAPLPEAALLDRSVDKWEALVPRYRFVAQNYRLISADRRLLWTPGGPRHAIAAVGRDGAGRILFIHCREPLTGVDFGTLLLALPIDVRVVMYAEGGSQAGLLVRTPALTKTWMGRHPADIWTAGNSGAPLPNVIGIRPRNTQPGEGK